MFQTQNHAEACKELGIPNPDRLQFPTLTDLNFQPWPEPIWQVVAIHHMLKLRERRGLRGVLMCHTLGRHGERHGGWLE